jgi:pimeloyl-ACP methyl ester carboxylesterase
MPDSSVEVDGAAISYGDVGSGPPLVFVHGAYVTGALWDDLVARLIGAHRCITPTWPFGAQRDPVGSAVDLGVAVSGRRIVKLLEALELSDVTLIANDTGGGVLQSALADSTLPWDRVSRLVFTNCDSFEHFPPSGFAPLVRLCRLNQTVGAGVLRLLTTGPGQAMFIRAVTRHGVDRARRSALFGGFVTSAAVRREAACFTAGLHPRHTLCRIRRDRRLDQAGTRGLGRQRQAVPDEPWPPARRRLPEREAAPRPGRLDLRHARSAG